MANEIKILSMSRDGGKVTALFYYAIPVAQRITDPVTSSPFVHSPTAGMAAGWTDLLSTAEQTALNAGESLVVTQTQAVPAGTSAAALLTALDDRYTARAPELLSAYQDIYIHKNKQFDATGV